MTSAKVRSSAASASSRASAPTLAATAARKAMMRASLPARLRTSRGNTTAAAGAPPMTLANAPSTANAVRFGFNAFENTT